MRLRSQMTWSDDRCAAGCPHPSCRAANRCGSTVGGSTQYEMTSRNTAKSDPCGLCALCGEWRHLENSHVIPRTIVRQIQSIFPNRDLRWSANPDVPRQDIETYRLLCRQCENALARHEGRFSQVIFHPFVERDIRVRSPFEYRDWLLPFVVGLAWRTWARDMDRFSRIGRHVPSYVEEAGRFWRDYLRGERADPGPYEHHLLFATWQPTVLAPDDEQQDCAAQETIRLQLGGTLGLDPGSVNALQGTIASNVILAGERAWVFVNMGGVMVVSPIRPRRRDGFLNAAVRPDGGFLDPDLQAIPEEFRQWVDEYMIAACRRIWDRVSPSQREKAQQKTLAALERAVQSGSPEGKACLLALQQAEKRRAQAEREVPPHDGG